MFISSIRVIFFFLYPTPSFPSFILHSWWAVRSYWPHLEVRDPIWNDEWSHSPHRLSPSWGFPGVSLSVSYISEDMCKAPGIIPISPLALDDRHDCLNIREEWPLVRNPDKRWRNHHNSLKLLDRIGEKRTLLINILRRKANWIGHILRINCLLHDTIERQKTEVKGLGRRRTQLLVDLRNRRRYWGLKEEAENWKKDGDCRLSIEHKYLP